MLLRREELAKGWLLALVEDVALEDAAAILAGDVARDGPRICDAVVRAIGDDADLRRIERDGVLEPLASQVGAMAGAHSAVAAAHAVETLKDVVWSALRGELAQTDPELLADAAERLSLVTELVRAAVLRSRDENEPGDGHSRPIAPLRVASPPDRVERREAPVEPREDPGAYERREGPAGTAEPGLRREGGGAPGLERTEGSAGIVGGVAPAGRFEERRTTVEQDAGDRELEQRVGGEEPGRDALWIGALRDEIVRAGRARVPLSLLLVELEEAERMLAVEPHTTASATFGRFAQAVRGAVRRRDVLACETESRAWIIARDTGRAGAQALGSRIATSVPEEESWRGAPLTVSVGVAVLGEDGHNAAALIDAAEQTRFAAEASGIGILGGEGDEEDPGPPSTGPSLVS